jgi:hypothetical protein
MREQFIKVLVNFREMGFSNPSRLYDMSLDDIWGMVWAHQELRRAGCSRHPHDPEWMDEISMAGRVLPEQFAAGVL